MTSSSVILEDFDVAMVAAGLAGCGRGRGFYEKPIPLTTLCFWGMIVRILCLLGLVCLLESVALPYGAVGGSSADLSSAIAALFQGTCSSNATAADAEQSFLQVKGSIQALIDGAALSCPPAAAVDLTAYHQQLDRAEQQAQRLQADLDTALERIEEERRRAEGLEIKARLARNEASVSRLLHEQTQLTIEATRFDYEEKIAALQRESQKNRYRAAPASSPEQPAEPAPCSMKDCALLLSGKYFQPEQQQQPAAAADDGVGAAPSVLSRVSNMAGSSALAAVRYEYEVFLGAVRYLWTAATEPFRSTEPVGEVDASNSTDSTSSTSSPQQLHPNGIKEAALEAYYSYLDPTVEIVWDYINYAAYYAWRVLEDAEDWQELLAALTPVAAVQRAVDYVSPSLQDILGGHTDTVLTTVFCVLLIILALFCWKLVIGLVMVVVTIALLPVLLVGYGLAKLCSAVRGGRRVAKKKALNKGKTAHTDN